MGDPESQLVISCHDLWLMVAGLGCIYKLFFKGVPWKSPNYLNCCWHRELFSVNLLWGPSAEDNTHTYHWTWRRKAGTCNGAFTLHPNLFGTGQYSAGHKKRNVETNEITKPLTFNLFCLQNMLGWLWHKVAEVANTYLTWHKATSPEEEPMPDTAWVSKGQRLCCQRPKGKPNTTD